MSWYGGARFFFVWTGDETEFLADIFANITEAVHDSSDFLLVINHSLFSVWDLQRKMWLTPEVKENLTLWKNPRDTGIVFGFVLVFLLGIKYVSIISVLANMSLALITSTMAFRIYKSVLSVLNKTQDGHPFKVCTKFCVKMIMIHFV